MAPIHAVGPVLVVTPIWSHTEVGTMGAATPTAFMQPVKRVVYIAYDYPLQVGIASERASGSVQLT